MTASFSVASDAIYLVAAVPLVVAIVVAVAVWRSARRERIVHGLRAQLSSRDPEVRRRALDATSDAVLSAHAGLYCDLLAREDDPDVLDALAAAVARSRWEPSDDIAIVELRRWVAGSHARATVSSAPDEDHLGAVPDAIDRGEGATLVSSRATSTQGAAAAAVATRPSDTDVVRGDELDDLVPRVRELLGDLERLELVSIDGEVLKRWSSTSDQAGPRRPGGAGTSD